VVAVVGIFVTSVWGFQFVKAGFFPASTTPQIVLDYWLAEGTDIYATEEDITRIGEFVSGLDGVNTVQTSIGGGGIRYMLIYPPESANSSYAHSADPGTR
jgi:multidrug efflux pump subunit AcrB